MNLKGTSIFILLLITPAFQAICQFKATSLLEGLSELPELNIAVNPRTPENIVAICGRDRVFVTTDGGAIWKSSKLASSGAAPCLITDDRGNFFSVHVSGASVTGGDENAANGQRVLIQRSGDGGVTWSLSEGAGNGPASPPTHSRATFDSRGNLYVTWIRQEANGNVCKEVVLFSMSKNGKKWTAPAVIAQNEIDCSYVGAGAMPAVTYDGKVVVAWSHEASIYLDRSFNGGDWWLSNDILVSENKVPAAQLLSGKAETKAILVTDNSKSHYRGSLYIAWADQRNGSSDVWFTRSHNFGDNWSLPARIGGDDQGGHRYMPSMTVDPATGNIYVVYYKGKREEDDLMNVYLSWSNDGGTSFQTTPISEVPFPVHEKYATAISAQKGVIVPAWSRMEDGKVSVWTTTIRQEDLVKKR